MAAGLPCFGAWLGWGAYAAALFDAVENYALARMLLMNQVWSPYPQVAAFSASVKFGLLALGIVFCAGWLGMAKEKSDEMRSGINYSAMHPMLGLIPVQK